MRSMLALGLVFLSTFIGSVALGAYTPLILSGSDNFTLTELRPYADLSGSATLNIVSPGQINCGWNSTTFGNTVLNEFSTLNMSGGSITSSAYRGLIFNDSSTFNFSDGLISSNQPAQLYDNSTMYFSGGLITGHKGLELFEDSSLIMTGGAISSVSPDHLHGIISYDNSNVNVSSTTTRLEIDRTETYGTSTSVIDNVNFIDRNSVSSNDSSHLTLNDVTISHDTGLVLANNTSEIEINGLVTIGGVQARDSSKITITGKHLGWLEVWNTAEAKIIGYDFTTSGGLTLEDGQLRGTGTLYGKWNDGTDLMFSLTVAETAFAHVAPEPGTLAMLAAGGAAIIKRRRK